MRIEPQEQLWHDAERRIWLEVRRLQDVTADIRRETTGLSWRGPAADRFHERTDRQLSELADQRDALEHLLTLIRAATRQVTP